MSIGQSHKETRYPSIAFQNPLAIHWGNPDPRFKVLLESAIQSPEPYEPSPQSELIWDAQFFKLDQVKSFQKLNQDTQNKLLKECSLDLLMEAYSIEKAGMSFTAKMTLSAETLEERMLYSLFAADEATHFHWIASQVPETHLVSNSDPDHPFLKLLSDLILFFDRSSLILMIQVLLEGWGIHHYSKMAHSCKDSILKNILKSILRDEARHHGSGLLLFEESKIPNAGQEELLDIMLRFFEMVQIGPRAVVARLESQCKGFTVKERTQVFEELQGEKTTFDNLILLKSLIAKSEAHFILSKLEHFNAFIPKSAELCAQY